MTEMRPALNVVLNPCRACPRKCGVNRLAGERGFCKGGAQAEVASVGAHFGEESVLVGRGGSGTIFFQGCSLGCVFCQNYNISQEPGGQPVSTRELASMMLGLQKRGCSNVNLVTPTHYAPQILQALELAHQLGLGLPVVYNCGGYESVRMLEMLEGQADVYMPDFKYGSDQAGRKFSAVPDYPRVAEATLKEMYRQVGALQFDARGLALRGVLVRHLVLPQNLADSEIVVRTVAQAAPKAGMNVMAQYRPTHRAFQLPELLDVPRPAEVERLRLLAEELELVRVD